LVVVAVVVFCFYFFTAACYLLEVLHVFTVQKPNNSIYIFLLVSSRV